MENDDIQIRAFWDLNNHSLDAVNYLVRDNNYFNFINNQMPINIKPPSCIGKIFKERLNEKRDINLESFLAGQKAAKDGNNINNSYPFNDIEFQKGYRSIKNIKGSGFHN